MRADCEATAKLKNLH